MLGLKWKASDNMSNSRWISKQEQLNTLNKEERSINSEIDKLNNRLSFIKIEKKRLEKELEEEEI